MPEGVLAISAAGVATDNASSDPESDLAGTCEVRLPISPKLCRHSATASRSGQTSGVQAEHKNGALNAPVRSQAGNVQLVLDSGEIFTAHDIHLRTSSEVLDKALDMTAAQGAASLLLPGISAQQVLLLLRMLYSSPDIAAWTQAQTFADLRQLASVCHALACEQLLAMVQRNLVLQVSASVNAENALEVWTQAAQCSLKDLQEECSRSLLELAPKLEALSVSHKSITADQLMPVVRLAHQQKTQVSEDASELLATEKRARAELCKAICSEIHYLSFRHRWRIWDDRSDKEVNQVLGVLNEVCRLMEDTS